MVESLVGKLLVASPQLTDGVFGRTVCLVMHHDDDGAIGLFLNRPLQPPPGQVLALKTAGDRAMTVAASGKLHFGGPLAGPVVALHAVPMLAEAETGPGVFVAAQQQHLEALLEEGPARVRLIIGHSGWSAGQLESEIDSGLWYVMPATADAVFGSDDEMWPRLLRRASGDQLARWVGAQHRPPHPECN